MSFIRGVLRIAPVLTIGGALGFGTGCGDDTGDGGGSSAGTGNTAGSSSGSGTSAGNSSGGSGQSGAGTQGGAGSGSAGTSAGSGGAGGSQAGGKHCGTGNLSIIGGIDLCDAYDATANGLPPGNYTSISTLELSSPITAGEALGISQKVSMGTPSFEYWGANSACGPALQKLGSSKQTGISCVDSSPTASYAHLLLVRLEGAGTIEDMRACPATKCP